MNFPSNYPEICKEAAFHLYKDDRLNCAESVFKALLVSCGMDCPIEQLRIASGFGGGIGRSGCTCGALVGSVMAAGLVFGRTEETGPTTAKCISIAHELHDAFKDYHGSTCCRVLHRGKPFGTDEQKATCAQRCADTAELAAKILVKYSQSA